MTETTEPQLTESDIRAIGQEAHYGNGPTLAHVDALIRDWRAMKAENVRLQNQYEAAVSDFAAEINSVREQLARAEKERTELQHYARTADESATEMTIKNHEQRESWRSHVILVCGEKVAEYERSMRNRVARTAFTKTYADAASEIRTEVENL